MAVCGYPRSVRRIANDLQLDYSMCYRNHWFRDRLYNNEYWCTVLYTISFYQRRLLCFRREPGMGVYNVRTDKGKESDFFGHCQHYFEYGDYLQSSE